MSDTTFPPFHKEMQCGVSSVAYDFTTKTGTAVLHDGHCTDMSGCIAFYEGIDPAVTTIRTFAGEKPDTVYFVRDGEWHSVDGAA